jgi:hypothetical protein
VDRVLDDGRRRARQQRRRVPRRLVGDVHLVRADGRAPGVLPRPDPVRRRCADRSLRVLRDAGRRTQRAHLQRLGSARHVRRRHGGDHRRVHDRLGRHHPDPDVSVVARARRLHRLADVPHGLVGVRAQRAADQRRGARLGLVRDRSDRSFSTSCSCSSRVPTIFWPTRD